MRRRTVGTIRLVVLLVLGGGDAYDGDCGGNCCFGNDSNCGFDIFFNFLGLRKLPWDVLGKTVRLQEHQEHL